MIKRVLILALLLPVAGMATDNCPSAKTWMAGNIYYTDQISNSNAAWFSTHYDVIINGVSGYIDTLLGADPTTKMCIYTNIHMLGRRTDGSYVPDIYRAVARFFDSAGISMDSAFVHFSDSVVVQSLADGSGRWLNIDSLKDAGSDSCTRVSLRGWYNDSSDTNQVGSGFYPAGDGDWFCNMTSPTYQNFRAAAEMYLFLHQDSIYPDDDSNYTLRYCDNWLITYNADQANYWLNGSNTKVDSFIDYGGSWSTSANGVDWDISNDIHTNQFTVLSSSYTDLLAAVQDSMEAAGADGCIPNMTSTTINTYYSVILTAQPYGVLMEYRGDDITNNPPATGWNPCRDRVDTVYIADSINGQKFTTAIFWEFRYGDGTVTDTTSDNADRMFLASFNAFLCMQTPNCYYHFGRMDMDIHWEGHEVDLGDMVDSLNYDSFLVDNAPVYFRRYTKGISIYRPMVIDDWGDTGVASIDAIYLHDSVGLGDTMLYKIDQSNDTAGSYAYGDTVHIKRMEGMMFLFSGEEHEPTISNIQPTDTVWYDSTDAITCTATDDYGINRAVCYIRKPSYDSVDVMDSIIATGDTSVSFNFSNDYTWADSGDHYIVFRMYDDSMSIRGDTAPAKDSVKVLCDVYDATPQIGSIAPTSAYKDSTDAVSAQITDDYGIDSAMCFVYLPDSTPWVNDSVHLGDSAFSPVEDSLIYTNDYTWTDSGDYWIFFWARDGDDQETMESLQILVSVQALTLESKTFNYSTGMIDAYGNTDFPTTNYGDTNLIKVSEDYYHIWVGDYSMDDTLEDSWDIDSAYFIWKTQNVGAYDVGDTTLVYLSAITKGKDWVENQATWTIYKTGNLWATAGGDTAGCISDTIRIDANRTLDIWDTILIHSNTVYGSTWLSLVLSDTGNFGFQIINEDYVGDKAPNEVVYIYSSEYTSSNQSFGFTGTGGFYTSSHQRLVIDTAKSAAYSGTLDSAIAYFQDNWNGADTISVVVYDSDSNLVDSTETFITTSNNITAYTADFQLSGSITASTVYYIGFRADAGPSGDTRIRHDQSSHNYSIIYNQSSNPAVLPPEDASQTSVGNMAITFYYHTTDNNGPSIVVFPSIATVDTTTAFLIQGIDLRGVEIRP